MKTPSDDNKTMHDALLKANLTDSMIDKMSESMIDNMENEVESCAASSGVSSEPVSDFSSQPGSDISNSVASSDVTLGNTDYSTSGASSLEQTVRHQVPVAQGTVVDLLSSGIVDLKVQEHPTLNGNSPVPMDTTSPIGTIDLIGSLNGHSNGVDNSNSQQHSR